MMAVMKIPRSGTRWLAWVAGISAAYPGNNIVPGVSCADPCHPVSPFSWGAVTQSVMTVRFAPGRPGRWVRFAPGHAGGRVRLARVARVVGFVLAGGRGVGMGLGFVSPWGRDAEALGWLIRRLSPSLGSFRGTIAPDLGFVPPRDPPPARVRFAEGSAGRRVRSDGVPVGGLGFVRPRATWGLGFVSPRPTCPNCGKDSVNP
jgi:hypothetical protein